jgi:hypothetical protein
MPPHSLRKDERRRLGVSLSILFDKAMNTDLD